MGTATASTTGKISLEDTFADLAASLADCLQAVVAARPAHRSSLPALRLALRCLASLIRLARLQPAFLAATIDHVRRVLAATQVEFQASQASQPASLSLLAVRITCQTHLTRLAEQQLRASKRSELQQPRPPASAPSARSAVVPSAPRPPGTMVIVADLATPPLVKMPPAVAAPVHDRAGSKPLPPPAPLTQRAKWLAAQEHKQAKRAG